MVEIDIRGEIVWHTIVLFLRNFEYLIFNLVVIDNWVRFAIEIQHDMHLGRLVGGHPMGEEIVIRTIMAK